jgi:hypothetical protein
VFASTCCKVFCFERSPSSSFFVTADPALRVRKLVVYGNLQRFGVP